MKKKIILALTACLFAAGSIINVHLAQNEHNMDFSLADISVMAQADGESGIYCYWSGIGHCPDYSCVILRCFQSVYNDPGKSECTCGEGDKTVYL
ncbi:MAG: hypothetical protein EA412_00955 [Chitinophagaceae bacterium]|nr:MAG: hypothetical protein EA412_00955 [Chitinophagaceae bacterium]